MRMLQPAVIPAQAGIQHCVLVREKSLGSHLRGNDEIKVAFKVDTNHGF